MSDGVKFITCSSHCDDDFPPTKLGMDTGLKRSTECGEDYHNAMIFLHDSWSKEHQWEVQFSKSEFLVC